MRLDSEILREKKMSTQTMTFNCFIVVQVWKDYGQFIGLKMQQPIEINTY